MTFVIVWIVGCFAVASFWKNRGGSPVAGFIISLGLSPLIGFLAAFLVGKACPSCGGKVRADVAVCRHCGRDLPQEYYDGAKRQRKFL